MVRKILIIKPDSKFVTAHKLFAFIMKSFVMSEIEVVNISTSSYCFTNLDFLFLCRIYFRLEAL